MIRKSLVSVLLAAAVAVLLMPTPVLASLPAVTTDAATNITASSARLNGELTSLGTAGSVMASFEYGTSPGSYADETIAWYLIGTAPFYIDLSDLIHGMTYYYRAKAVGDGTSYGEEKSFTTLSAPPLVTTNDATNVTTNSARLNGELTSLGTASSVAVSLFWAKTGDYFTKTPGMTVRQTGTFHIALPTLMPNTIYQYWAEAEGDGTVYGEVKSFTTADNAPYQPTNVSPIDGTTDVGLTLTLQSSSFYDPDQGDTHAASQWQLTTTAGDYSTIVVSLTGNAVPTNCTLPAGVLDYSTTYYWRVRYQDSHGGWSERSMETSFVTVSAYPRWDINGDGIVDYKDLAILGAHYGETH